MTWALIAVVAFAAGWLLLPLAGAWAGHSSRLDPPWSGAGRPIRRVVDWLGEHWRVQLAIVVVLAAGYAVSAGLMFVGRYHLMGSPGDPQRPWSLHGPGNPGDEVATGAGGVAAVPPEATTTISRITRTLIAVVAVADLACTPINRPG